MIRLLLYNPILLLRKTILYTFILIIVVTLSIYTIANSTVVIQKLANMYAPDYNISFSSIHGNVVTGVEIDNLSYNNQKLADNINFHWNPAGLLNQRVIVNTISITHANIKAIEIFVKSFENNDSNASNESDKNVSSSSTPYIPKTIELQELKIDIVPVEYEPVAISYLKLQGKSAIFDISTLTLQTAQLDLNVSSNLANIIYSTKVKDNHLIGKMGITPHKELFDKYKIPVRRVSVGDINLDLNISTQKIKIYLNTKMRQLLIAKKGEFNLDIDSLSSHITYDINKSQLQAYSKARVTTPYAKDILVSNIFNLDSNISYRGDVYIPQILGVEKKYIAPAKNLYISYSGDTKRVDTNLSSDNLQGSVNLPNFTKAIVHLITKKPISINQFVSLPKELNQTKANLIIDSPIYFDTNKTIRADATILSDMVNIDAHISYKDRLNIKSNITIPKSSNLREYQKNVNWNNINPISAEINLVDKELILSIKSKYLRASGGYNIDSTKVNSNIILDRLNLNIKGYTSNNININTNIKSIPRLLKSINSLYKLEKLPIKGSATIAVNINKLQTIKIDIKSPQIIYQADSRTTHTIKDINFGLNINKSNITLDKYSLTYNKEKIFATKPSHISIEDESIKIAPFWINDELQIVGGYSLKLKNGNIDILSNSFKLANDIVEVDNQIDIKTSIDGNDTSIIGDINILGGRIKYDLDQKSFASDSDIIILQDVKSSKPSPFMRNLTANIKVKTTKDLIYKKSGIDIRAKLDLTIFKAKNSPLMILGSIELPRGGSYKFKDKKFILNRSYLYFTGNPSKPTLAISIKYKSLNHKITIRVTGSADNPNIKFSSSPALTEAQILSVILFDTTIGAENNSGTEMMRMMGGAIAKSALSNLGIKIDHLILGEGNSIEIGKKISNRVTIIYVNDIISSVKIKYEHNRNTDSILQMNQESQSYDIVFKKRF